MMLITNIQRFSLHDGPGIRTTIFLKGCSLRCPWCSNPENISADIEQFCMNGNQGVYGIHLDEDMLIAEITKDKIFYGDTGGITLSGGEPLLQYRKLLPFLKKVKDLGIHIAVETSLFVSTQALSMVIDLIDFYYVDIKILDDYRCRSVIGGNLNLFKENFNYLAKKKRVNIRVPVIKNYTDDLINREEIIAFVKRYEDVIDSVELLQEHHLGDEKYKSLNRIPIATGNITESFLELYRSQFLDLIKEIPIYIQRL